MWINYLSTTSSPPPPIDTIKPVPLNPKLLWANLLTIEGVADEIQAAQDSADGIVELQAELEKDHTSRVDENKQSYDGESSGESAVDDEYAIVMQKLRQSKAVKNREAQAKKKTTTVKKLRTKVIDAVTKIRAAAKYMVEKKLPSNLVKFDGRTRQDLGQEAFWKKIVSVEDLEYYESRLTIESILNTVDAEIQSSPEFEWIPTRVLSAQQQKEKLQRETQHAEQFSHFSKFYKTLLCRSKESTEREVVARAAIETLQKRYQKDLTKEGKVNAAKAPKAPKVPIRQKKKTRTQLQEELISQLQNDNNKLISQLHNQQSTDDVFSTAKETKQKLRMTKRTRVSSSASESESGSKSSCSTKSSECSTQSTGARSTLSKSKKNSATLPVQINISDDEDTGYFEDTSNETNAKENDIKIGNKFISLLKSKAKEQLISKRVQTVDKAKESFLQLLNVTVVAEFSFTIYKANLVELPTMFNVTLSNTYTVEQLSKPTLRNKFLLELVGAIVSYTSCSSSSSIPLVADLSLPSILQNIFDLKDFVKIK